MLTWHPVIAQNGQMPAELLLTIAIVLGLVVAASAVMAVLAWLGVAIFRARERRQPAGGTGQSPLVAGRIFELGERSD